MPSALQDAEHISASFQHIANLKMQHEPRYYWEHHMCASFMVDPLGLDLVDRIGVDKVMWSTDFPHNESTYGYSSESLKSVVDAVGAEAATAIVSDNVKRYLGRGRTDAGGLMAKAPPTDASRRRRTSPACSGSAWSACRRSMRQQGLDALVLLGNTNVAYATGAIWPLADSGRANFEQPVAVVLADDEWPHLFTPVREDDRLREKMPADHLHGPVYLDFDEGVQLFATQLGGLVPAGAVIAMDEWTNALRREQSILFASGAPEGRADG